MKIFGSISRLVNLVFRKNSNDVTVRPNQATTYTASRDIQLPAGDTDHVIISASSVATLTNKTFDADGTGNSISNIENADIKAGAAIDASKIADGTVSNAEFQFINSVTSNVQTQIDGKASTALSNLASVAINTTLVSDTNNTDDLGTDAIEWKDAWVHSVKHNDATNPDLLISTTGNNGDIELTPHGTGAVNVNDANLNIASGTSAGEVRFYEPSGSGTNYSAFKAQAQAGDVTYTLPAAAPATNGFVLSGTTAGVLSWVSNASSNSFAATWLNADGATKTVVHNLGSVDVMVEIYDISDGQTIFVDTILRTDANTLDLTSSEAPAVSWRVLITAI